MKTADLHPDELVPDLMLIHRERIEQYEQLADQLPADKEDLQTLITQLAEQSRHFAAEWRIFLPEEKTTREYASGSLYKQWQLHAITTADNNRKSLLHYCEVNEDALIAAYKAAAENRYILTTTMRRLLREQLRKLSISRELIQTLLINGQNQVDIGIIT